MHAVACNSPPPAPAHKDADIRSGEPAAYLQDVQANLRPSRYMAELHKCTVPSGVPPLC